MKSVKVAWVFLAVLVVVFPLALRAQTQPAAPAADVIPETEIRALIDKYIDRYKAMDLDAFMAVFSKGAVENRMLPYADIKAFYKKTFDMTNQFLYHLDVKGIQSYTNSAFVSGRYEIIQTLKEGNEMVIHNGNIQWDLVKEEGSLKIRRINFGRDIKEKKFWKNL